MSPITLPFSGAGPLFLFLAKATLLLVAASVATPAGMLATTVPLPVMPVTVTV